jgi:hypothetical protein
MMGELREVISYCRRIKYLHQHLWEGMNRVVYSVQTFHSIIKGPVGI